MSTSPEKIFEVIQTWCANRLNSVDESGGPCRARFLGSEAAEEMLEIYQALKGQEKQTARAFTHGIITMTKLFPPEEYHKNPFFSTIKGLYIIKHLPADSYKSLFVERFPEVACLGREYKQKLKEKKRGSKRQHLQLDPAGIGKD